MGYGVEEGRGGEKKEESGLCDKKGSLHSHEAGKEIQAHGDKWKRGYGEDRAGGEKDKNKQEMEK